MSRKFAAAITSFLGGVSCDTEMLDAMAIAYVKAGQSFHDRGQPPIVQKIIALRIMAFAA